MGNKILIDREVVLKYIPIKGGFNNKPGHLTEGGMLEGSFWSITPLAKNNSYIPFLTPEEVEVLGKKLGHDLSISNKAYWDEYTVALTKEDRVLNLNNASDYLEWKMLSSFSGFICPTPEDLRNKYKASYRWCFYNTEDEVNADKAKLDKTTEAYIEFGSQQNFRENLEYLYRMLESREVSAQTSLKDIQTKFMPILANKADEFLKLTKDELFDIKVIINTALKLNVLESKGGEYFLAETHKPLTSGKGRATLQVAAAYLQNIKNKEVLDKIEARITTASE